jgi:BirA family biotin operon repressor/biotin-[acetyl-CoA-carboxylase] ligase
MNLIVLPSVDSTNNYLQQLLNDGMAVEGTMVVGLEQTNGRGQRGNVWESAPGLGLYVSLLLEPVNWTVDKQFVLNKAIAVGIARYLETKTTADIRIKWPNDLMADGGKISGVLIENNIRGSLISSIIVGIGINLNHPLFPNHYETPPVSLFRLTGVKYDAENEAKELFRFVWLSYKQLMAGEQDWVEAEYAHRLYKRGEKAAFSQGEEIFFGVLQGVDDAGKALIRVNEVDEVYAHPSVRFYSPARS